MAKMIKKKLKDLTLEELNGWRGRNCYKTLCGKCLFYNVQCNIHDVECWAKHKELYSDKFLDQEVEVEGKANYLNGKERDYLNSIIALFKEDVLTITKRNLIHNRKYIEIVISLGAGYKYTMDLCPFEKDTMYKNMELDKEYTPEDLGL